MNPDTGGAEAALARQVAQAGALFRQGRTAQAEQFLLGLIARDRRNPALLEALLELYLALQRAPQAMQVLERLLTLAPEVPEHYLRLGALLERERRWADIAALYGRMTEALPDHAVAHFNHACYLARCNRRAEALPEYHKALALGIDGPAEVWSNIGSTLTELRRDAAARDAFEQALALDPRHVPALYNLGLLHEEFGERDAALARFECIVAIDPRHHDALVRIAHARTASAGDESLLRRLEAALQQPGLDAMARENLHFALGKMLDDCARYDAAFVHYQAGNACSRMRLRPYGRAVTEAEFDAIMQTFSADWLRRVEPVSQAPLVFICGMFRSGSTLVEQLLAAHPALCAGGEIDYLHRRLRNPSAPVAVADPVADRAALQSLGHGYIEHLSRTFATAARVTDKRPDNFVYLGLLKGLFPRARFVNTVRRDPLDNCLSIWFQQLEDGLGYACSLEDTAHYLLQYRRLMAHWKGLFGANIFDVDYERLVAEPESVQRQLLAFLELPWDDACLAFPLQANRVRTASVWQVRRPIHRESAGRWRHYENHLAALRAVLAR